LGVINVDSGQLDFINRGDSVIDAAVDSRAAQAMPPNLEHVARPLGIVRFSIDVFTVSIRGDEIPLVGRNDVSRTKEWLRLMWEASATRARPFES
jgi:hypothetical protein